MLVWLYCFSLPQMLHRHRDCCMSRLAFRIGYGTDDIDDIWLCSMSSRFIGSKSALAYFHTGPSVCLYVQWLFISAYLVLFDNDGEAFVLAQRNICCFCTLLAVRILTKFWLCVEWLVITVYYCIVLCVYRDSVHDHVKMNIIIMEVLNLCRYACFEAVLLKLLLHKTNVLSKCLPFMKWVF